jgi:hypothetical protein
MNEDQVLHYDLLKIENIFLFTLVQGFFLPNCGLLSKVSCFKMLFGSGPQQTTLGCGQMGHNKSQIGNVGFML